MDRTRKKWSTYCHGYKTNTWKQSAEVPMAKFVSEKERVNIILLDCGLYRSMRDVGLSLWELSADNNRERDVRKEAT